MACGRLRCAAKGSVAGGGGRGNPRSSGRKIIPGKQPWGMAGVLLSQSPNHFQGSHPGGHPMKFHIQVPRAPRGRWDAYRCTSILATSFICAALFFASQFASQAAAQSRFDRDVADHTANPTQDAASATPQTSAPVVTPAGTDALTSVP